MNNDQKQIVRETCRSHTTKGIDREFGRTCPSKLTKRELEDLYFALLDNNLELKQTINTQNEKIKQLSTKVQRLSAVQKAGLGKIDKDCCSSSKAVIREQKDIIAEQKRANDRLSERNRILNMRLCSAKQFLGKNSVRCNKCCLASTTFVKNLSTSAPNIGVKISTTNMETMVSNTDFNKEPVLLKSAEVQTSQCELSNGGVCDENRCRTLMEELKQKIVVLEEELCKSRRDCSSRVSVLEQEAARLRRSGGSARTQQQGGAEADRLLQRLRAADALCEDINHQLSMEKRKVSELETRLKAADVSAQVASTIEQYLRRQNLAKDKTEFYPAEPAEYRVSAKLSEPVDKCTYKQLKNFDDSGYMEAVMQDEKKSPAREISNELREKILELQTQLNCLKRMTQAVERDSDKCSPNFESYDQAIEEDQISMLRSINDYNNTKKEPEFNLLSSKAGEVYEIKKPESYILQERREESINEKVIEPSCAQPIQTSNTPKPNWNLPTTSKGILEKPEEYNKTHKKDEKMSKSVSYEDIIFHNQNKDPMKNTLTKIEEQPTLCTVGYSPSDDKHLAGNEPTKNRQDFNENDIGNRGTQTNTNDYSVYVKTDCSMKEDTHRDIRDKPQKPFKEQNKSSKYIHMNNKKAKNETQLNVNREQTDKCKKNISMDVTETVISGKYDKEGPASKTVTNNVPNIEIVKSDSSDKILSNDEMLSKGLCIIPVAVRDDIKVIKEVGSVSDVNDNLPKAEQIDVHKEEAREKSLETSDSKSIKADTPGKQIVKGQRRAVKELELCARRACVCMCPRAARRELVVFRTCSGTSRFEAVVRADTALRQCGCEQKEDAASPASPCSVSSQTPGLHRTSSGDTYVVRASAMLHRRARSPPRTPDTDGEISALTDLPDERDVTPRSTTSPGEERQTATYTETYTSTTDYITLSEGELPLHAPSDGRRALSPGERKWKNSSGEMSPPRTTSQKMEEALHAIGEELARCRQLLQHQRPQQHTSSKDESSMTEAGPDGIALRKAEAQPRITHAHAHLCCFTLHISSIVLSDQAVAYSHGKSLVLMWRFYNRNATMAHMNPGRVVHFDFTTEYQLLLTEHFLDYLKAEDMSLKICEMEKPTEVFASCTLPLRDALAHANRRADMSLPLVAGAEMLSSRVVTDALDSGDEVGVLDVWCMLKVEPSLLSALRKVTNKPPTVTITAPTAEDQTSVYHLTHDLEAKMRHHSKTHKRISGMLSNETFMLRSAQDVRQAVVNEIRPTNRRDMSDSNTIYSQLRNKHWRTSSSKTLNGQKKSVTIGLERDQAQVIEEPMKDVSSVVTDLGSEDQVRNQTLDITVLWLALNDESVAVSNPNVQRIYVAYSFLGRDGAELETPVSLPKPKTYTDKCHFNFNKKFQLNECDLPLLGHMAKCRRHSSTPPSHRDCLTFSVVSEPPEDPLGLDTCEDIGYAHLYLGDVLARCAGSDSYTEVLSVLSARSAAVSGVLAVRVAGLQALRRLCKSME